ncbi:MAG: hypothetical protein U1D65_12930 [Pseudomonas sp.]|nr:hypothetical protein [Pseudomonas sp.]MDZ4192905.1 hypothetical protein [Pseudomonas sp.]
MPMPYENATSGDKAFAEIQKILGRFGCDNYGIMQKTGDQVTLVQFDWRGRTVQVPGHWGGYASQWLKENPYTTRMRRTQAEHKQRAMEIAQIAVCSLLRDWVKAQVTMVECQMMTLEEVFMPHMLLPDGKRLVEHAQKLLPSGGGS